jgi:glucose/mannose-6-phosphate isomerase
MTQITHEIALNNFYHQIQFAVNNYHAHGLNSDNFSNVIIAGLGGSGIGGRIAKTYFADKAPIPIEVYSDYNLPAYASSKSLIILSSYSGLTEETLAMYDKALSVGATVVCITSGGILLENAKAQNLPYYIVEGGYQPRMALGFSLTYNFLILSELFGTEIKIQLENAQSIYQNTELEQKRAKDMLSFFSNSLKNKFVIVADGMTEALGVRFCQQIQENAKAEAFINVLPEANHNVFETYYGKLPNNFIFLNSNTHERNIGRFGYLKELLEKQGNLIYEINLESASVHEIFKTIHMNDWFSIFLSNELGKDNMSVPNISGLKDFLLRMNATV